MKIVFFGSSQFAVPALRALVNAKYNIACVVTQPDRRRGRHLVKAATPVKEAALEFKLEVFQPTSVNTDQSLYFIKVLKADLFVVAAFGQILSEGLLQIPKISINIHASLLPKYRGAAPINWAIIKGEEKTGVTIIKLVCKMDAGPMIAQRVVPIAKNDDASTLEPKLAEIGAGLLLQAIDNIKENKYTLTPQKETEATFAPKLNKNDGLINWQDAAEKIHNLIRGCIDWPGAFTYYKGKMLKIYKTEVGPRVLEPAGSRAGQIIEVTKEKIVMACGKDSLEIKELQLEGKRRMKVEEFISGHKISVGEILG